MMDMLPSKMLFEILRHTNAKTRHSAMQTCQALKSVFDTYPLRTAGDYLQNPDRYQVVIIKPYNVKNEIPVPYTQCNVASLFYVDSYNKPCAPPGRIISPVRGGGASITVFEPTAGAQSILRPEWTLVESADRQPTMKVLDLLASYTSGNTGHRNGRYSRVPSNQIVNSLVFAYDRNLCRYFPCNIS